MADMSNLKSVLTPVINIALGVVAGVIATLVIEGIVIWMLI